MKKILWILFGGIGAVAQAIYDKVNDSGSILDAQEIIEDVADEI